MTRSKRLGWIPDRPDHRDNQFLSFASQKFMTMDFPKSLDLRKKMTPIEDQGDIGSCTSFAIAGLVQYLMKHQQQRDVFVPSHLFIYYNERAMEWTVNSDSGAQIRDGMKVVAKQGVPHETLWPYVEEKFAEKPPKEAYDDGLHHQVLKYYRVNQDEKDIKTALSNGYPVVFGFTVYESFDNVGNDGMMTMPTKDEKDEGGHAVLMVGYTETHWIVRNSWGSDFGDKGYFYMPIEYALNEDLACDFWTATLIE